MRTNARPSVLVRQYEAIGIAAQWQYTALPVGSGMVSAGLVITGHPLGALIVLALALGTTQITNPCGVAHTCALTRPVHDRSSTGQWLKGVMPYTFGGCISGAAVGAALGILGIGVRAIAPFPVLVSAIVILGMTVVIRESGMKRFPIPEAKRQTRALWSRTNATTNAFFWGLDVGTAFLTWQMYAGAYVLAAISIALGSPAIGAAMFITYWLGRALPHWLEPFILDDPERPFLEVPAIGNLRTRLGVIHAVLVGIGLAALLHLFA